MRKKLKLIGITAERCSRGDGRSEMGDGGGRTLSTFHLKPPAKRSAFTLIEMIGVMALMAILAAVVVPPLFRTLEEGQRVDEDKNQEVIAEALLKGIKNYATFPNPNSFPDSSSGWVTLASNFYPKGSESLRYVFPKSTNKAQTERRVYLDPLLVRYLTNTGSFSMPSTGFSSTSDIDSNGVVDFEETLRLFIVSSSKEDLPLFCEKNGPSQGLRPAPQDASSGFGATLVNDLLSWIKAFESPGTTNFGSLLVPGSIAKWGNASGNTYKRGEYLHVKIVPLDKIFCRVTVQDCASPPVPDGVQNGNGYTSKVIYPVTDTNSGSVFEYETTGGSGNINVMGGGGGGGGAKNRYYISFIGGYGVKTNYPTGDTTISGTSSTPAKVRFLSPGDPGYRVGAASSIQILSGAVQTASFYVIAGTAMSFYTPSEATKSVNSAKPILSSVVYNDTKFFFKNSIWTEEK